MSKRTRRKVAKRAPIKARPRLSWTHACEKAGVPNRVQLQRKVDAGTFPQPDGGLHGAPWWYADTLDTWTNGSKRRLASV
jgi:hypothetical protein